MKKYFEFIAALPKEPGFREILFKLVGINILISLLNIIPIGFIFTFIGMFYFAGFWVEYLSNSIRCDEVSFPPFKNNTGKFISFGFRYSCANFLFVMPFVILAVITGVIGFNSCKESVFVGETSVLVAQIVLFTAIILILFCIAFYIFPLIAIRFAVTKSFIKTLNLKRLYVLWYKSKDIYQKMFNDIVMVSLIFFLTILLIMFLPLLLIFPSLASSMMASHSSILALLSVFSNSIGLMLISVVFSIFTIVALTIYPIVSTLAIYKIIATYYRIPPKGQNA